MQWAQPRRTGSWGRHRRRVALNKRIPQPEMPQSKFDRVQPPRVIVLVVTVVELLRLRPHGRALQAEAVSVGTTNAVVQYLKTADTKTDRQAYYNPHGWLGGVVVGRCNCDREVASSTPGRCIAG